MFFIVLFLAAVFLAREKHSVSSRIFLMTFSIFPSFLHQTVSFRFHTPGRRLLAGVLDGLIEWDSEGVLISELLRLNSFCPAHCMN